MKIAYVLMTFPAPSETFAANDARALVNGGDDVTVFAMRPPHAHHAKLIGERSLERIDIRSMTWRRIAHALALVITRPAWVMALLGWSVRWTRSRPRQMLSSFALIPSALMVFRDIHHEKFDVVHLFWGHYPSMIGHLLERFDPKPVRSIFLGAYDLSMAYGGSAPVARGADVVWTHAAVNVPAIRRLGIPDRPIHVAYRGVDSPGLDAIALLIREDDRVPHRVVTAARLIPSKGIADVIRAFAAARLAVPDATLVVLGEGPEHRNLEALIASLRLQDAVQLVGHLPHADALREIRRSEVFVLLSTKPGERLPNAVKEAMALGCICVVARTPGLSELLEHERHGFIVDPNDEAGAAREIERALLLGSEATAMRAAAEAHIRTTFDLSKTMKRYRDIWAEFVQSRNRPVP